MAHGPRTRASFPSRLKSSTASCRSPTTSPSSCPTTPSPLPSSFHALDPPSSSPCLHMRRLFWQSAWSPEWSLPGGWGAHIRVHTSYSAATSESMPEASKAFLLLWQHLAVTFSALLPLVNPLG